MVGRNSAGKSTFARSFPLFRQSVEEKKRAPILWYGRLVDFGGFKDALNRGSDASEIEFGFELDVELGTKLASLISPDNIWHSSLFWSSFTSKTEKTNIKVNIDIGQDSNSQSAFASKVEFIIFGNKIAIVFNNQNSANIISVNGENVWSASGGAPNVKTIVSQRKIIPTITFARSRRINEATVWNQFDFMFENLVSAILNKVHGNTSRAKVLSMISA